MTEKEKFKEAKRLYQTANADQRYVLETLFPELKESEDEKVRKAILELVRQSSEILDKQNQNNMIAWLEKQAEVESDDDIEAEEKDIRKAFNKIWDEKQGEQKPAWSEVDNFMYNKIKNLLTDISLAPESRNSLFDWFKSIKDRVQPKQEWSEEDKQYFNFLEKLLENLQVESTEDEIKYGINSDSKYYYDIKEWLKSIKTRITWKPNEKQVKALRWVLQNIPYNTYKEEISGLLDQIKKL